MSSICISAAALPNIEKVLRPTGVWQRGTLELLTFSELDSNGIYKRGEGTVD